MTTASLTPVLSNVLFAGGLALLTITLARPWRNPHLAHALWLLVLIKLVTPPFVEIPVPESLPTVHDVNLTEQGGSLSSGFHASLENSSPVEKLGLAQGGAHDLVRGVWIELFELQLVLGNPADLAADRGYFEMSFEDLCVGARFLCEPSQLVNDKERHTDGHYEGRH